MSIQTLAPAPFWAPLEDSNRAVTSVWQAFFLQLGGPSSLLQAASYTPTLTIGGNVTAVTAYPCQYLRLGGIVLVSGRIDIDPTGAGAASVLLSLPIGSALSAPASCAGTASSPGVAGQVMAIRGDVATGQAELAWIAVDVTNQAAYFTFSYQIEP